MTKTVTEIVDRMIEEGMYVVAEFANEESQEPLKVLGSFQDHGEAETFLEKERVINPEASLDIIL